MAVVGVGYQGAFEAESTERDKTTRDARAGAGYIGRTLPMRGVWL